jgi:TonB family protein
MYHININDEIDSHGCDGKRRDGMLGLGISIGLHAAGLLFILLLTTYSASHGTLDTAFVNVYLVQMAADNTAESEPFPGIENGKTPYHGGGYDTGSIHHSLHMVSQIPATMEQKPRKYRKRQRRADISGNRSGPEPATASVPGPSDSSLYQDAASSQHIDITCYTCNSESGPADHGVFESDAGLGNGLGNGSGTGGASVEAGGTGGGFNLKQVDQPPVPIQKVDPEFPPAARKLGAAGKVVIKFLVKADGSVVRACILEANPEGLFDQSALDAIGKWRFTPGIYQGNAVATWVILPVHFRLTR